MRRDQTGLPGSWRAAPPGQGSGGGSRRVMTMNQAGNWTPTTVNLLVLIALEIGGYIALRYAFRSVHAG